jgi:hypothetical protein
MSGGPYSGAIITTHEVAARHGMIPKKARIDQGRVVPDLDFTSEISELLMKPFGFTSVRKFEAVTG